MKKIYYLLCTLTIVFSSLLLSEKSAKAAESYVSGSGSAGTGETITAGAYSHTGIYPDGRELYEFDDQHYDWINTWNITQNVRITGLTVGKYYNGMIKITYANSVPSGVSYRLAEMQSNQVSDSVRVFVYGTGTVNIDVIFDNYYARETMLGLPSINQLFYDYGQNSTTINISVSVGVTATNLISTEIPTASGLAGVIEYMLFNAIEGSTAIGEIYSVLNTIKTNDINYFSTLISQLTQSNTYLNSINTLTNIMLSELQSIDTTTTNTLTALTNYISFMQLHIPYLDNIATNTLNTYNQLVTILNYLKNRPTHNFIPLPGYYRYENGQASIFNNHNHVRIYKEENIEYAYVKFDGSASAETPTVLYFENFDPESQYNIPTRVYYGNVSNQYGYVPIDFRYNETVAIINTSDYANLKLYIGDGYTFSALMYWIQRQLEMSAEESSEAAAIESEYQDKDNTSATLLSGLGSVNMPELGTQSFDILSDLDAPTQLNFFSLIGTITRSSIVTKIMLIIVTGAIVGMILYGKKV